VSDRSVYGSAYSHPVCFSYLLGDNFLYHCDLVFVGWRRGFVTHGTVDALAAALRLREKIKAVT